MNIGRVTLHSLKTHTILFKRMKYLIFILLCLQSDIKSFGQTFMGAIVYITKEKKSKRVCVKAICKDTCTSKDSIFLRVVEARLNESNKFAKGAKKGKYIVEVKFIKSKDGCLKEINCVNDPGYEMCGEVIFHIKHSSPLYPCW